MEYPTKNQPTNDQTPYTASIKLRFAAMLWNIQEPAAHSVALQLIKTDRHGGSKIPMDRSLAVCIGLIGLALLEELI